MIDAAADLQTEARALAEQAAQYRHLTETTELAGRVFDHAAPLPKQPTYRPREWEQEGNR